MWKFHLWNVRNYTPIVKASLFLPVIKSGFAPLLPPDCRGGRLAGLADLVENTARRGFQLFQQVGQRVCRARSEHIEVAIIPRPSADERRNVGGRLACRDRGKHS